MNFNNIKKEKFELNILSSNLISKNDYINQNSIIQRPDSLDIKVKSTENIVNLISRNDPYIESVNSSWNNECLDNFILQIKNVNNTPSPITPNSFFNPSDVTQDQEQFADALTLHLNKIKEDYKSGIETTIEATTTSIASETPYLNNLIHISSINQEKPISIGTVNLGNKVYLLNQINLNLDSNENQCLNYGVMDSQRNNSAIDIENISHRNNITQQPLKISQFQSLHSINQPTIICNGQNLQFSTSYIGEDNEEIARIISNNNSNFLKTSEGVIYTRIPDSSHGELLNQLNSLANSNPNISRVNPNVIKSNIERECFSASSNDNDSSYGTNDSSIKTQQKDGSSNGSRLIPKDEKDIDEMQRRLERKRARNRDAARKCRDRKNSLIITLEQKYAKQTAEKDLIRDKLLKSLEEIRRLTEYISKHDPHSKFGNFSSFLNEIKIHELTETDLRDLNLL